MQIARLPKTTASSDGQFDAMLLAGELDAIISPNVLASISRRDPRVRRLFTDGKREEQRYFTDTGIFPISHVVALDRSFVERHPHGPAALLAAYRRARDVAFARIEGSDPVILVASWVRDAMAEQREVMGERYWAYNLGDNAVTLDAMTQFAHEQGITSTKVDYLQFFDDEAASMAGW
jgi:4,5-dihydroxyphthalate decarboxylase